MMSFAAIVVAVAAIGVSVWQGRDNRKHNMLSVKPKLQIVFRADPKSGAEIVVTNDGLGPATITDFKVLLDGELLDESPLQAIFQLVEKMGMDTIPFNLDPIHSMTIRAGNQLHILKIEKQDGVDLSSIISTLVDYVNRTDLEITYESMYGERFGIKY